jgi:hypothetical protein
MVAPGGAIAITGEGGNLECPLTRDNKKEHLVGLSCR